MVISRRWICLNFEEFRAGGVDDDGDGDFYTIVVVVKVCILIVSNCKSYVIEKFCIVCDINNNYCEHEDLNGGGHVCCDADCLCDGHV